MKKLMSNKDYHASESIGSSLLKSIALKSLLHAVKAERKESAALDVGSALHAAVLEPETFNQEFLVSPNKKDFEYVTADDLKKLCDVYGLKKTGKKEELLASIACVADDATKSKIYDLAIMSFETLAAGKTVIDEDQMTDIRGMVEAIKAHEIASQMLSNGEAEYSYFAKDPITGLERKCRPDYLNAGALIDLKSCQDASPEGFIKACVNFGYHIQAAYYLDTYNLANGTNLEEFFFVAVESKAPYAVNTFRMGSVELELGRKMYRKALDQYAEYLKDQTQVLKFGYEHKINEIEFPMWALNKTA